MIKWYQDSDGSSSFMRIGGMIVVIASFVVIFSAIILAFFAFFQNKLGITGVITTLVVSAFGAIGVVFGAKAVQSKNEV